MAFNVNIVETSILTILKTILLISLILLAGVIMTAKFDDIITPETPGIFNTSLRLLSPVTSTKRNTFSGLVVSYLTSILDVPISRLLFCLFSILISLKPTPNVCDNILKPSLKQSSPYPQDGSG